MEYYLKKNENGKFSKKKWCTVYLNDLMFTDKPLDFQPNWSPYAKIKEYQINRKKKCGFRIMQY